MFVSQQHGGVQSHLEKLYEKENGQEKDRFIPLFTIEYKTETNSHMAIYDYINKENYRRINMSRNEEVEKAVYDYVVKNRIYTYSSFLSFYLLLLLYLVNR